MKQIIRELSDEMIIRLEKQRDWVRNHYSPESTFKYESINGKLELLDTIIKSNWIQKDETLKLQCLGVTLGDIIVQDLNFKWVEIEDEYGIDPALQLEGTSIIIFPLTMLSKRIEKSETINLNEFYNTIRTNVKNIMLENGNQ